MTTAKQRIERALAHLNEMLPKKVEAYGAAHELQPRLLALLLERYRSAGNDYTIAAGEYVIPPHVARQIPRITRCLDRIIRIVNAPEAGDLLGESPWLDLAGDAIAGQATVYLDDELAKGFSTGILSEICTCDGTMQRGCPVHGSH